MQAIALAIFMHILVFSKLRFCQVFSYGFINMPFIWNCIFIEKTPSLSGFSLQLQRTMKNSLRSVRSTDYTGLSTTVNHACMRLIVDMVNVSRSAYI